LLTALGYNLLLLAAGPLLALYLVYRVAVLRKSRAGLRQRLGWSPKLGPPPPSGRVWMHAVSAGEVVAAAAVAKRLRERADGPEIAISVTTPAGMQQAERLLPEDVARFYFPFDLLPCVLLALTRVRPTAIAPVETEIWPNWLAAARALRIRAALVNGQFADKGYHRAVKARWLYRWALGRLESLRMQTQRAAERAVYLGAPPERVTVCGNVKFEQPVAPADPNVIELVREKLGLGEGIPLWLAGSTHPGEEDQVLTAFRLLRESFPNLRLLVAPRHVERAQAVLDQVQSAGWKAARRSFSDACEGSCDILILDTMGELAGLYSLADVVFVGGSLVPIGGHDILQPLFQGKPTLFGPHMHNQHDVARMALEAGACIQVRDSQELASHISRILSEPLEAQRLHEGGKTLLEQNTGAAKECADLLASLAAGGSP
jgi:3-deoxy-D-manno-octulosonic-acid transferase